MDFTYSLPDEATFLYTLTEYLRQQGHTHISPLLDEATLTFKPGSEFTRQMWNQYWADFVLTVPLTYRLTNSNGSTRRD